MVVPNATPYEPKAGMGVIGMVMLVPILLLLLPLAPLYPVLAYRWRQSDRPA
ncbi:hypothetical protein ACFQL1_23135 [Halomicroarcula sp. GCM10025709]|uniref:hypothetical protein n=1 Tax=Haloarcula TaxID=2237 RepID=UPI0024C285F7|nr:hypothetical protein [Halomicroarcula sp. YJ-61-S]